jgi:glycine/D-amino acid oxidase-like deaminating enzyme
MKKTPRRADVVICGAGMAGICTAHCLAERGLRDILLVDKRFPLTLTSDKSAETYRVWWPGEANKDKFALLSRSVELMEALVREGGGTLTMRPRGHCHITTHEQKVSDFKEASQSHAHLGLGPLRLHEGQTKGNEEYVPLSKEGVHLHAT